MENVFSRVARLVKETGDRCIILDPQTQEGYVVMSLDDYERLRGQKKTPVADESEDVNKEIAKWHAEQPISELPEEPTSPGEDRYYLEPVE